MNIAVFELVWDRWKMKLKWADPIACKKSDAGVDGIQ
jgi:hypothetical protein